MYEFLNHKIALITQKLAGFLKHKIAPKKINIIISLFLETYFSVKMAMDYGEEQKIGLSNFFKG
ncbi:MAG: hypothetical protein GY694_16780 [Gammaproteobacteria bacterium]|nr:hypothetical protein [Gammaproteobacteria bacterium]